MNRYYLPVFDLMGYRLLNPNQREYHIYFKNSFEKLKKDYNPWGYEYKDDKNGRRIVYNASYESFRFYDNKILFDVGNNGCKDKEEGENEVFYSVLYMNNDITIRFLVNQLPINENNFDSSSIEIEIDDYRYGKKILKIDQLCNKALLTYLHEDHYPNNYKVKDIERVINSEDCTADNFIREIEWFITNNYTGEYTDMNKKSLYVLFTSLKGCIADLQSYWMREVIPYSIMYKEELLKDLESNNDENNKEKIKNLRNELDTLKRILYGENTTNYKLKG